MTYYLEFAYSVIAALVASFVKDLRLASIICNTNCFSSSLFVNTLLYSSNSLIPRSAVSLITFKFNTICFPAM